MIPDVSAPDLSVVLPALPTFLFAPSLAGFLSLLLTVLLPLAAGLLMKASWSTFRKGLVLLALAGIKAYAEAWVAADAANVAFNHATTGYAILINVGIAVAAYFGFLRHTGVQQAALSSGISDSKTVDGRAYPTR